MAQRLLIIGALLVVIAGCAKLPEKELHDTRRVVAYAYASGASRLAGEEYLVASGTLHAAEVLISKGRYSQALETLERARKHAAQSLNLTVHRKKLWIEEQQRLAEEAEKARKLAAEEAKQKRIEAELAKAKKKLLASVKPKLVEPVLIDQVEVLPNETLSDIAARKEVYSDDLLWPLIYKANRDQIKDPKEIFSGQILVVPRDKSEEEQVAAREEARQLNLFK